MAAEKKHTILIVDDEPLTCDMLAGFLIPDGYQTVFAYDGTEALQRVKEHRPDAMLLDVMMPDIDGYEVCRQLKSDKQWQHIPIILVTALSSKEELVYGLDSGADDFITKPVDRLELRARVRSMVRLKKQYDDLQATLHMRENLTHLIVHDIRIPLTAILGYTQLLLSNCSFSTVDIKDVQAIQTQAYRLDAFLNDMLILAKLEADQLILNCSMVNVGQLIKQVQESYQVIARSKGVTLAFDIPLPPQHIFIDENLIHRTLENLISNAIKFSPREATVTVQLTYPPKQPASSNQPRLVVRVLDEGSGISPADRERIFNKFEIGDLANDNSVQVGLGLAFCKMVVEAHRGTISIESNRPCGSIFTIEL